jgi:hypothetical protein
VAEWEVWEAGPEAGADAWAVAWAAEGAAAGAMAGAMAGSETWVEAWWEPRPGVAASGQLVVTLSRAPGQGAALGEFAETGVCSK